MNDRALISTLALLAAAVFFVACNKEQSPSSPANTSTSQQTPVASPLTAFDRDLQFIRNGQYTYILVLSRKDGKPIDKEDGDFLRKNASQVVDWVISDGGKKAIGGTNFNFEEGNMELLKKRFVVEDYSGR
jgi:hypothetical protein